MGKELETPETLQSELATLRKNMGAKIAPTYGTRYGVLRRSRLYEASVAYQGEKPSTLTGKKGTVAAWGITLQNRYQSDWAGRYRTRSGHRQGEFQAVFPKPSPPENEETRKYSTFLSLPRENDLFVQNGRSRRTRQGIMGIGRSHRESDVHTSKGHSHTQHQGHELVIFLFFSLVLLSIFPTLFSVGIDWLLVVSFFYL